MLLYDGTCGFCARSVQFVLRHERAPATLRFATLEGPLGDDARARWPELVGIDSVVWRGPDGTVVRSDAVLEVLRYLGGAWRALASIAAVIPRPVRDWGYDLVARWRYRIAGRDASCLLPTPEQRSRFLDLAR